MEKRERIGSGKHLLMLVTAIIIDVVGAVLNLFVVGGTAVSIIGDIVFFIWYWISGVPIWRNPKALRRAGAGALIELVPIVDILPMFTYFVWKTNKQIMEEDMVYNNQIQNNLAELRSKQQFIAKEVENQRQINEKNKVQQDINSVYSRNS